MIELRITKSRMVDVIRQYRGKSAGILTELKNGGIDIDKPYTQKRDLPTGDYIYMQDEPVEEFEGAIVDIEVEPKAKWTENFTPPKEKKPSKKKKKAKKGKK